MLHRCVRRASGCGLVPHVSETNEATKCFVAISYAYEQHNTPLKRSFHHQEVGFDVGVVVEIGADELVISDVAVL